jgi:hypothetical protein
VGDNPASGAVITYYQRTRHLFGKLRIEVLDSSGKLIDELPASTRRGLNRVVWTMHRRPPHVPPAAQLTQAGTQGPRVLPGTYTIRLHKNDSAYETPVTIGLDTRVKWSLVDRTTQHEAAMKVYALFNDESALFARIAGMREQVAEAGKSRPKGDALLRRLEDFDGKLDAIRKKIVATKEGGAITGEERLREHTDQLYGAITSWDGPPSAYQLENVDALRAQLGEIEAEFTRVISTQLPAVNNALKSNGAKALTVPPLAVFSDGERGSGGVAVGGRYDPDAARGVQVPSNLKLWN